MSAPHKRRIKRRPTHPGEMLREDFIPDYGLTVATLAKAVGLTRQSVNELLTGRRALSPEMALRLSFWLNAQRTVDLWDAAQAIWRDVARIAAAAGRYIVDRRMSIRRLAIAMGVFSFLFGGCSKQPPASQEAVVLPSKPLSAPPEVTSEQDEGFHDLLFYVQEHKRLPDGSQTLRGSGRHKGKQLGLEVVLGPTWKAGSLGADIPIVTYQGEVTYRSTGTDSDAFVQVLDELYGTKVAPKAMGTEIRFTAIALEGDPRDLAKGPVKIKLFFESEQEGEYAEHFTNIELTAKRLEVREKDQDYRLPLIKALQAR